MTIFSRYPLGLVLYLLVAVMLSVYFGFAAIQGDYGIFRRAEITSEARDLQQQLAVLEAEVARLENLTHRLSDQYLDLDLLDERARDMLGMIRMDEIVIR